MLVPSSTGRSGGVGCCVVVGVAWKKKSKEEKKFEVEDTSKKQVCRNEIITLDNLCFQSKLCKGKAGLHHFDPVTFL
jgi:hypothetical protein